MPPPFTKETNYVDRVIESVISKAFRDPHNYWTLNETCQHFRLEISSICLYVTKLHILEQAYELKLARLRNELMMPVEVNMPSFFRLSMLYLSLIRGTLLDSDTVTYNYDNKGALGDLSPQLYVICLFLASISARRSPNDGLIMAVLAGRSSRGKSRILDPFTSTCKLVATESSGVGRYQLDNSHFSIYWHDVTYAKLTTNSEINIVKNALRGEPAATKIRNKTVSLPPSYGYLSSNENLWQHIHKTSMTLPSFTGGGASREHIVALKARLIECFFLRRSPNVDTDVFYYNITLEQARAALSALVLKEFKTLRHPLKVPSPTLLKACFQGMALSSAHAHSLLGIEKKKYDSIVDDYICLYASEESARLHESHMAPLLYDE